MFVVVPVYNVALWLGRCVDSILSQEGCQIQVLLVDDGSTDGTGALCDGLAARDPRVRVVHTPNRGLSAARNLGIELALAEGAGLVCFVDSDDELAPGALLALSSALLDTGADLAFCGWSTEWEDGRETERLPREGVLRGGDMWRAFLSRELSETAWAKLYHASLLEGFRYPEGHDFEDIAATHEALLRCRSVVGVPVAGYRHYMRQGSIVHSHGMDNLADYWLAQTDRRKKLLAELGDEPWVSEPLRESVALAASRTWRWAFENGRAERRRHKWLLDEVTRFARDELPPLGLPGLPWAARMGMALARVGGGASLALAYALNKVAFRAGVTAEKLHVPWHGRRSSR